MVSGRWVFLVFSGIFFFLGLFFVPLVALSAGDLVAVATLFILLNPNVFSFVLVDVVNVPLDSVERFFFRDINVGMVAGSEI